MKFSIVPVALLAAFAASGAVAQDTSAAPATASSSASATSSSSSSSSAAPTSMSSSASGSSGGADGQFCTVLGGDPRAQPHGCPYSSTSTPPYNREYSSSHQHCSVSGPQHAVRLVSARYSSPKDRVMGATRFLPLGVGVLSLSCARSSEMPSSSVRDHVY